MTSSRVHVSVDDADRWVFNRIAAGYAARPAYPAALVDAVAEAVSSPERIVADLGAGVGHLSLPLALRGFDVIAVEPAAAMLEELRAAAARQELPVRTVHAAAESLPFQAGSLHAVVIADAFHFMHRDRASAEIARVLSYRGAVAVVVSEPAPTPYMQAVARLMEECSTRRPKTVARPLTHLAAALGVPFRRALQFHDEHPVDRDALEAILKSVSFIGPAMNPARFEAFRERVHALPDTPVWARTFTVHVAKRR